MKKTNFILSILFALTTVFTFSCCDEKPIPEPVMATLTIETYNPEEFSNPPYITITGTDGTSYGIFTKKTTTQIYLIPVGNAVVVEIDDKYKGYAGEIFIDTNNDGEISDDERNGDGDKCSFIMPEEGITVMNVIENKSPHPQHTENSTHIF